MVDRVKSKGICVLGMRFSSDKRPPAERFTTLETLLGDNFDAFVIPSGSGEPFPRSAHSVLTTDPGPYDDDARERLEEAVQRVLLLFGQRLQPGSAETTS